MTDRIVLMEITRVEAAHLADLVTQFAALLADGTADPAVGRLVPDAYRDDPDAAAEFRRLTGDDLLSRRTADARTVLATLQTDGTLPDLSRLSDSDATAVMTISLDAGQSSAWLRTLTALRLVLASRLGIADEDDRDEDDPRFGIYDWLGYRLEGLLQAFED